MAMQESDNTPKPPKSFLKRYAERVVGKDPEKGFGLSKKGEPGKVEKAFIVLTQTTLPLATQYAIERQKRYHPRNPGLTRHEADILMALGTCDVVISAAAIVALFSGLGAPVSYWIKGLTNLLSPMVARLATRRMIG